MLAPSPSRTRSRDITTFDPHTDQVQTYNYFARGAFVAWNDHKHNLDKPYARQNATKYAGSNSLVVHIFFFQNSNVCF